MHLNRISQRALNESMEAYDATTDSFIPNAFKARIEISDRFLSNFNKPLRRRMLFSADDVVFPASRTFRHPGTKDIYLLGQSRTDSLAGKPHIQLTVCHLVTDDGDGSAGMATLYRKAPEGPADNPGWLVEREVVKTHLDLEFRTSANEADTYEVKIQNFFGYMAAPISLEPWDFLELHGKRYRVVDSFADSGLSGVRVDEESDTRVDFVLHLRGARTYNKITHEYESAGMTQNVTGVLLKSNEFASWTSDSESYIDVSIEAEHIGQVPQPDSMSLEYKGRKRIIKHVSTQPGEQQYRLRCE